LTWPLVDKMKFVCLLGWKQWADSPSKILFFVIRYQTTAIDCFDLLTTIKADLFFCLFTVCWLTILPAATERLLSVETLRRRRLRSFRCRSDRSFRPRRRSRRACEKWNSSDPCSRPPPPWSTSSGRWSTDSAGRDTRTLFPGFWRSVIGGVDRGSCCTCRRRRRPAGWRAVPRLSLSKPARPTRHCLEARSLQKSFCGRK